MIYVLIALVNFLCGLFLGALIERWQWSKVIQKYQKAMTVEAFFRQRRRDYER